MSRHAMQYTLSEPNSYSNLQWPQQYCIIWDLRSWLEESGCVDSEYTEKLYSYINKTIHILYGKRTFSEVMWHLTLIWNSLCWVPLRLSFFHTPWCPVHSEPNANWINTLLLVEATSHLHLRRKMLSLLIKSYQHSLGNSPFFQVR